MGLRGPKPTDLSTLAMRGGRIRPKRVLPEKAAAAWEARAEELERIGMQLVKQGARGKLMKTPSNGLQMGPKFLAGMRLLEAASEIWQRLYRVGPPQRPTVPDGGDSPGDPAKPPSSLD